ncbi:MAG: hypothetical protein WC869_00540 [Phycisphaerae bacterium]|jgi:hypothetical protein
MADQPQPQQPAPNPVFIKAEGDAMLQLAQTLKAMVESPAYADASNPSWWKRHFG